MPRRTNFILDRLFDNNSDAISNYSLAFYFCIGLLPGFITLIGDKAIQLPFIVIAILTAIRLLLHDGFRKKFFLEMKKPYLLLLMAFFFLLASHAIWGGYNDPAQLRTLQKPMAILLFIALIGHIHSKPDVVDAARLLRLLRMGCLIGLFAVITIVVWESSFFSAKAHIVNSAYKFFYIHKINRGIEVLSVLVFIAGLTISNCRKGFYLTLMLAVSVWALSFIIAGSIPTPKGWVFPLHIGTETVQFGLPVALIVFIATHRIPRLMTHLVFGSICFVLLSAPWVLQLSGSAATSINLPKILKFQVRAEIWEGVSTKILETPILGYGIDSIRYLQHVTIPHTYYKHDLTSHPHNMFLQIWLDLGFLGVAMVCGLMICGWISVKNIAPEKLPSVLAGIVMLSLFCLVTHSVWQTWSMAFIAIFSIIVMAISRQYQENPRTAHSDA